jgi:hypothetical protein
MRASVAAAAVFLATLTSCSTVPDGSSKPPGPRWPDQKQVDVGVGREFGWWGKLQVEVDQEVAVLAADNKALVWSLRSSAINYEFTTDGIRFEIPSSLPAQCRRKGDPKDFEKRCMRQADGRLYVCEKPRSEPGTCYKYTVKLRPRVGGEGLERDPWIMNE